MSLDQGMKVLHLLGRERRGEEGERRGGKREVVVVQAEGFQILCLLFLMLPLTHMLMNLITL